MSDSTIHQSYAAQFNAEKMPSGFSYLRPGGTNAGLTGEPRVPRYGDSGDDSGDD